MVRCDSRIQRLRDWWERHHNQVQAVIRRETRRLADGQSYDPDAVADAMALVWQRVRSTIDPGTLGEGMLPKCVLRIIDGACLDVHLGRRIDRDREYVDAIEPRDWSGRAKIDRERRETYANDPACAIVWEHCQRILSEREETERQAAIKAARDLLGL